MSEKKPPLRGGSGNFAANPQRAAEVGRKGGENSHKGARRTASSGTHGRAANPGEGRDRSGDKGGRH